MKKIFIYLIVSFFMITTIQNVEANNTKTILVIIKNDANIYLIKNNDKKMNIHSIPSSLYIPITCLKENSTIDSVNFTGSYNCLVNSIQYSFDIPIDSYVYIDMPKVLKRFHLHKNTYDYKTLNSLTKTGKIIKDKIDMGMLLEINDYIETDLNLIDMYDLYHFFKAGDLKIHYYFLKYYIYNNYTFLFDNTFYLKDKS